MHIVYEYQLEYLINKRSKVKVSIIKNTFVRRLSYAFVRRYYTFVRNPYLKITVDYKFSTMRFRLITFVYNIIFV